MSTPMDSEETPPLDPPPTQSPTNLLSIAAAPNPTNPPLTTPDLCHAFASSLLTNDKESLVAELRKILGASAVNEYVAGFLLDMNNWNLPLAINSYFDLLATPHSTSSHPAIIGSTSSFSARPLPSSTHEININPNVQTQFSIQILNDGVSNWPPGTTLRYLQGDFNIAVKDGWTQDVVPLGESSFSSVRAGETTPLTLTFLYNANLTTTLTKVRMTWQLATPDGYLFGQLINITVNVVNIDGFCNFFGNLSTQS